MKCVCDVFYLVMRIDHGMDGRGPTSVSLEKSFDNIEDAKAYVNSQDTCHGFDEYEIKVSYKPIADEAHLLNGERAVRLADVWPLMEPNFVFILKNEARDELYSGRAEDFPYRLRGVMNAVVVKIESDYGTILVVQTPGVTDEDDQYTKDCIIAGR